IFVYRPRVGSLLFQKLDC
ncbi:unnamed protein product, partial [Allacma fusca]